MDASLFLRGLVMGFSIAAPVGPIGILCIRRSLADGQSAGFLSGLGAATADGVYGSIAAFGLTFISSLLISGQVWMRLIGGLFLAYLGIRTILTRPAQQAAQAKGASLGGMYLSTIFLTITNPMTILSFAAAFSVLGVGTQQHDMLSAGITVAGVFCGSAAWWFLLSGGVSLFRQRFKPEWLVWVNRVSGGLLVAFGTLALLSLLKIS